MRGEKIDTAIGKATARRVGRRDWLGKRRELLSPEGREVVERK